MKTTNQGLEQANEKMENIRAMVTALNVDYRRLKYLNDEYRTLIRNMSDWEDGHEAAIELTEWQEDYSEEAEELYEEANGNTSLEEAEEDLQDSAMDIDVRSDWTPQEDAYADGGYSMGAKEFRITLVTGGPEVHIRGEMREDLPVRAWLEYSCGGSMTERVNQTGDQAVLVAYARRLLMY